MIMISRALKILTEMRDGLTKGSLRDSEATRAQFRSARVILDTFELELKYTKLREAGHIRPIRGLKGLSPREVELLKQAQSVRKEISRILRA